MTKKIKEDLDIDIEFIIGDDTKLNTFFASGDMPDIISIFDANASIARQAESWAWPLQDLAEKYDPYFLDVASEETLDWYQLSDGKSYGYPDYSNTAEDYASGTIHGNDGLIIREDVYEAIGRPDMTTPEGFLEALNSIKEQFPDLIPLGFNDLPKDGLTTNSLDWVVQDLIGVPYLDGDQYNDRNLDEDYITWLKTLRQAHENGAISDDSFTDDNETFKNKISSGKYAAVLMSSFINHGGPIQAFASSNPDGAYMAIDAVQSTVGNEPILTQAGISGWMINYITKDAKDPAKAIQVFTYLLSDYGQMLTTYGIEGETYEYVSDDEIQFTPEALEVQQSDPDKWKKEYRVGEFCQFGHDKYRALNPQSYQEALHQMMAWADDKLQPQFETENIEPDPGTSEARALSAIKTNWSTTLVSAIRASSDEEVDRLITEYETFQDQNSIEEINQIKNEKIAENKEKLGM
ncbi:type 2 periplasmic-binding domain-containing protein [Enterococcus sp. LJL90]